MDAISAILALLQAIPGLVDLFKEAVAYIEHASGGDVQGFIKKLGDAIDQLKAAQTEEERQNAARAISDAIRGLG